MNDSNLVLEHLRALLNEVKAGFSSTDERLGRIELRLGEIKRRLASTDLLYAKDREALDKLAQQSKVTAYV